MKVKPDWFYDELKHAGVDYSDPTQVAVYDNRHQKFRDYQKGAEAIIDALKIGPEHTVIDMGVGTGAFSLYAAPHCQTIYAVDVSPVMLEFTRQKAEKAGLTNIVFCPGGLLTYEHRAPAVDAIVSVAVLHHLPDFWKLVGLRRLIQMMKPGGRLFLFDLVFPIEMTDYETQFEKLVSSMTGVVGLDFAAEIETHLRDEYSTYDRVMEEFLVRAGFRIDQANYADGFKATYLCTRAA
ncbi:MAG: class I SAM-dependent methyltransferase [Chloroflexota bacterium]